MRIRPDDNEHGARNTEPSSLFLPQAFLLSVYTFYFCSSFPSSLIQVCSLLGLPPIHSCAVHSTSFSFMSLAAMLDILLNLNMRDMIIAYIVFFFLQYVMMIPFVWDPPTPVGVKIAAPRKLIFVCLVHSTVAVIGSAFVIFNTDAGSDPMHVVPKGSELFLRCTMGYLIFDVLFMVCNRQNVPLEATVIVHHANTFFALFVADYYNVGLYFCGYLTLNEGKFYSCIYYYELMSVNS
jgi:hypothetical protein